MQPFKIYLPTSFIKLSSIHNTSSSDSITKIKYVTNSKTGQLFSECNNIILFDNDVHFCFNLIGIFNMHTFHEASGLILLLLHLRFLINCPIAEKALSYILAI